VKIDIDITNTWAKYGFQKAIKDDDGFYFFKFDLRTGVDQILEQGSWMFHNTPIILTKWSPNLSLTKDKVTKVPVWVKMLKVPVVAYYEDGLSLIATQIGRPIMLNTFTSEMCIDHWGRFGFARGLIKVCNKVLRSWDWNSNASLCAKGCRIIIGWNVDVVDLLVISQSAQGMHDKVFHKATKQVLFVSFIYAANSPIERRMLWRDLEIHKRVTWNQKPKGGGGVLKKLDRMGNIEFCDAYKDAYAVFQPYRISDHSLSVLKNGNVDGHKMFRVVSKLKALKKPMRKMVYNTGHIHERVIKLRHELDEVQKALDTNPADLILREEEATYLQAFNEAKLDEERFLKQKAKIEWLEVGDSNSAYFHKSVKSRNQRCRVNVIRNDSTPCDNLNMEGLFQNKVSDMVNSSMVRTVSDLEIKAAMFDIGDDRAPGPDGFTAAFFKKAWDIVGLEVCEAIKDFFCNGQLWKEINHTFLALIPKVPTPLKINDYRLISYDLFLFARGNVASARVIMNLLDEFKAASGLVPSKLPVKYLRVPLISSRLLNRDCKVLVESAKNRIGDWKNKSLSFPGRLQLCKPVISSMQVYWASVLAIPKGFVMGAIDPCSQVKGSVVSAIPLNDAYMSWGWPWYNTWGHQCLVINWLSPQDIASAGFHIKSVVAELISNGDWIWPQVWLRKAPNLNQICVPILAANSQDATYWRDLNGKQSEFSVKCAWEVLRMRGIDVAWFHVVWFAHCIPRHAFHLWLVMQNCLRTHDELRQWDITLNTDVLLYIRHLANMEVVNPSIQDILTHLQPIARQRTASSIVGKLLLFASSYYIWIERNNRLFKNAKRSPDELRDSIMVTVRLKLMMFRFKNTTNVTRMLDRWKMPKSFRLYGC
ncbi:hypothetical protein Tco_0057828, partial [Tanacetum coccineum]